LQILATVSTADNVNRIVARSDRGIKTPGDLSGKKIGTQRASAVHYFLNLFLDHYMVETSSIKFSFMKAEKLPEALESGNIDAFSMREPYITRAKELLGDKIIIFELPGLYVQTELMVSNKTFAEQNPVIIEKLLKSLIRSENYAKKHRQDAIETVAAALNVDSSIYEKQWNELDLRIRLDQHLLTLLESQSQWAIKHNIVPGREIPNFLKYLSMDEMIRIRPEAVTIIR
jgi:ABC-type nitrate/sulfonate/bicarbonate transport system substrate-binding protein